MKSLVILIACIGIVIVIEYIWGLYLDSMPKNKRDEIIKDQSQMRCTNCFSTDFEVVGMKHGKLQWQCKHSFIMFKTEEIIFEYRFFNGFGRMSASK